MCRNLLSLGLVGMMALLVLMDVAMVKCFADDGKHQAIETIGHQNTASTCEGHSSCGERVDHAHEHPVDCVDKPLLDGVLYHRSSVDCDVLTPVFAILPLYYDSELYLYTAYTSDTRLYFNTDPLWPHSSIDDYLTVRLLI